ncbi:HNH endonuclease [Nocardia sp. NPDC057227]|uniref:HNH endonuclease n=1 Tax=Nocardia sp. NPDC057227 TaxID=3346056 RepID=UPI003632BBB7
MSVSKRVRYEVLRRDNHTCRYCGGAAPDVKLTVDHVVPVALGGSDDPTNLVTACADCNGGKTSTVPDAPLVADVNAKAVEWAKAMAIVAQGRAVERAERYDIAAGLFDHWAKFRPDAGAASALPVGWENSIWQFMEAGLEVEDLEELMVLALTTATVSQKWKYFCGCCWKSIKRSQEHASRIVANWSSDTVTDDDDRVYTPEVVDWRWECLAKEWREDYGTQLAECMCDYIRGEAEFCGDYVCKLQLHTLGSGMRMNPEYVRTLLTATAADAAERIAREDQEAH